MNWTSRRPWLGTLARLVLGAVLLWSAWVKLDNPRAFVRGVLAYDVTPNWLGKAIAYGLPVLEICIAVLLIVGVLTRLAAIAATIVLVVLLAATIEASARGLKLDTGIFSDGGPISYHTNYLITFVVVLVLLGLAAYLCRWPMTHVSADQILARNDYVEAPSAKRLRSEQGRRKYESEVASKQAVAIVRNRYLVLALSVLVVLITLIGIGVQAKRVVIATPEDAPNGSVVNGITVGNAAKVTLDIFEDFQCPQCQAFQRATVADVNAKIKAGTVQVRYHMVAILDRNSDGNRYSSRAANAAICASDISVADFQKYHDFLYGKNGDGSQIMPAIGNGRTDSSLINYAKDALGIGLTDLSTYQTCVQSEEHAGFVLGVTNNFTNRGLLNVPTVLVNGKKLTTLTQAALDSSIATAAAKAPPLKVTPSATPSAPASGSASVSPSAASSAVSSPSVVPPSSSTSASTAASTSASSASNSPPSP